MASAAPIEIRDRVIELRRVNRGDVLPNKKNFRRHPDSQKDAMKGILKEVGVAGAALAYYSERNDNKLTYVDGHLRDELIPENLPVLITDLNDGEADLLLASYDPIAAMATADKEALDSLLHSVNTSDAALQAMLSELAAKEGIIPPESFGTDFTLPDGDRSPFQQMTFTVSDAQAETIKEALALAKQNGEFADSDNANSNGNALALIAESYCG